MYLPTYTCLHPLADQAALSAFGQSNHSPHGCIDPVGRPFAGEIKTGRISTHYNFPYMYLLVCTSRDSRRVSILVLPCSQQKPASQPRLRRAKHYSPRDSPSQQPAGHEADGLGRNSERSRLLIRLHVCLWLYIDAPFTCTPSALCSGKQSINHFLICPHYLSTTKSTY